MCSLSSLGYRSGRTTVVARAGFVSATSRTARVSDPAGRASRTRLLRFCATAVVAHVAVPADDGTGSWRDIMRSTVSGIGILATATLVLSLPAAVSNRALDDWPQWRGPNRDGISAEKGLLEAWPQGGPPLAWRTTGAGEGYSSFATSSGRLFTLGARGNAEYVMAFDINTGKRLWDRDFDHDVVMRPSLDAELARGDRKQRECPFDLGNFQLPVVAGGQLFVTYRGIACYDARTGDRLWRHTYGVREGELALSDAEPIVDERTVYTSGEGRVRALQASSSLAEGCPHARQRDASLTVPPISSSVANAAPRPTSDRPVPREPARATQNTPKSRR